MFSVTKKGQVTIPKEIRERLGIEEGDNVSFSVKNRVVVLKKIERRTILDFAGAARGRKIGPGSEREYAKRKMAARAVKESAENG